MTGGKDRVGRRRVFYIPGYDPFHPRRYRELYRKEGAEQARICGYALTLRAGGPCEWQVTFAGDGAQVETRIEVLTWSDIVTASMGHSIGATYGQLVRTAWIYLASGALFRLARLRKGPTIAALYPIAVLLLQAGVALAAGWGLSIILSHVMAVAGPMLGRDVPAVATTALGLAIGAAFAFLLLRWFRRQDSRIFAWYLMHDYAFTASAGGAVPADLRPRLAAFADRIAAALAEDWDEVLVVGHSSGAHLAVSVLADLIRGGRVPAAGPALGFLSLGQVVPMVSFLPGAHDLRADLAFLSTRDELAWVDVTAPGDGCAYALCDPVAVSGATPPGKRWPLVVSAAFTQTLSPERWKALRWRFFRLHFQYLCAFDRPGDYDYFRITAGPLTLAARYRGRTPSKSRIETPLNPYGRAA
ncbi:MAG: hypothetical protein ACK4NE_04155 [Albidovulum sp.]